MMKLNCFKETEQLCAFPRGTIHTLRKALLIPAVLKPNIQQALRRANFQFHRNSSISQITRDCNVGEGRTILVYWGCDRSYSRGNMSACPSSCSSVTACPAPAAVATSKDFRSVAQQTDISCWQNPGVSSPDAMLQEHVVNFVGATDASGAAGTAGALGAGATAGAGGQGGVAGAVGTGAPTEGRALRAVLADSVTLSSPASSVLSPTARSPSLLDSVCALLLNKQVTAVSSNGGKDGASVGAAGSASEAMCRICFGGASSERLVRPCLCRGTVAAVHRSCLERWLLQAATSYCELCRHHYVVTRTHKWSWARSAAAWARSAAGRALAADAWRAAALGALGVAGTARALHACDALLAAGARRGGLPALAANLLSSLLIGVIGALNGLLTTWMLLKLQEHQQAWRAWRDAAMRVRVALPPGQEMSSDTALFGLEIVDCNPITNPFYYAKDVDGYLADEQNFQREINNLKGGEFNIQQAVQSIKEK